LSFARQRFGPVQKYYQYRLSAQSIAYISLISLSAGRILFLYASCISRTVVVRNSGYALPNLFKNPTSSEKSMSVISESSGFSATFVKYPALEAGVNTPLGAQALMTNITAGFSFGQLTLELKNIASLMEAAFFINQAPSLPAFSEIARSANSTRKLSVVILLGAGKPTVRR